MQARLFSYLDTQLTRLGGPNFTQLPINRTHCPVNDMLRDGLHQSVIHTRQAPYRPNSIDDGEPLVAEDGEGGYVHCRTEQVAQEQQEGLGAIADERAVDDRTEGPKHWAMEKNTAIAFARTSSGRSRSR
jgi:catalase